MLINDNTMINNNINIKEIEKFAWDQYKKYLDGNEQDAITFEYDGIDIVNPFLDETGRFEVNPIEYYGQYFLDSSFINIK